MINNANMNEYEIFIFIYVSSYYILLASINYSLNQYYGINQWWKVLVVQYNQ